MKSYVPLACLILLASAPALAQTPPPGSRPADEEDGEDGNEVVVTGARQRGAVEGDIPPELQLNAADVRSYGASSVAELLEALGPQVRSGAGRGEGQPVVLLNGRRVSGFAEVRDLPTEAILRVDILPEEVALKYGYRADQRVVNFVLRPRFRARTAEGNARVPTEGETADASLQAGLLQINRAGRFNLDLQYRKQTKLLEDERGILNATAPRGSGAVSGTTDLSPFRTLRPSSDRFSANATLNRTIFGDVSATLNGRLETNASEALLGLPSVTLATPAGGAITRFVEADGALGRLNRSVAARAGLTLNGDISRAWRWSMTAGYDRTDTRTRTDRGIDPTALQAGVTAGFIDPLGSLAAAAPFGRTSDTARSIASVATVDALVSGSLFDLPAGAVNTAIRVNGSTTDFSSRSLRAGIDQRGQLGRDSGGVRANLDVPIANAARDVLPFLGRLSLNANAEVEQLSDFGTLTTLGYGLNWAPITAVRLIASMTHEEGAPTPQQLGDPSVLTPNARVFDFVRGETIDVTRVDGGNPALVSDNRRAFKLGLTLRPLTKTDLTFQANFDASRIDNPIAGFPTATAAIEAAFPERFQRDAAGRLLRIDNRAVNFARSDRSQLRYGLNFSMPVTTERSRAADVQRAAAQERRQAREAAGEPRPPRGDRGPGGGFGRGGGRGGFGGGAGAGGRLNFGIYHTVRLTDTILIRDGLPELDLLGGDATGSRGGQPRHEVEVNAGFTRDGIGARLDADWQSATRVNGGTTGAQTLRFGTLTTINLNLFANLGQRPEIVRAHPFLRGSRLTIGIDNLLNQRLDVSDPTGATPINYQPAYLDALGRTIRLGFRKLF